MGHTTESSSLYGISSRGRWLGMLYGIRYFSLTEKVRVQITPESPSSAKKTKSYMKDEP